MGKNLACGHHCPTQRPCSASPQECHDTSSSCSQRVISYAVAAQSGQGRSGRCTTSHIADDLCRIICPKYQHRCRESNVCPLYIPHSVERRSLCCKSALIAYRPPFRALSPTRDPREPNNSPERRSNVKNAISPAKEGPDNLDIRARTGRTLLAGGHQHQRPAALLLHVLYCSPHRYNVVRAEQAKETFDKNPSPLLLQIHHSAVLESQVGHSRSRRTTQRHFATTRLQSRRPTAGAVKRSSCSVRR